MRGQFDVEAGQNGVHFRGGFGTDQREALEGLVKHPGGGDLDGGASLAFCEGFGARLALEVLFAVPAAGQVGVGQFVRGAAVGEEAARGGRPGEVDDVVFGDEAYNTVGRKPFDT